MRLNTGTPPRVPLCLHRFAIQAEGIALRIAHGANTSTLPSWSREPLWLACAASRARSISTDHGRPPQRDRPAPPCKSAEAPARLYRAQAIDPDTEGNP